jgi:SWI/SNF-related matrix-associated actin-dependent regulator 1 of chromatin subfamily A
VPASSPFRSPKPKPLDNRLAPAGTFFRPPPRPQAAATKKRPAPEPIELSDDDGDLSPPRGDIRPTNFRAHVSSFAYNPAADDKALHQNLRRIFDKYSDRYSSSDAKEALKACHNDIDDAVAMLESNRMKKAQSQVKPGARRLFSKDSLAASSKTQRAAMPSSPTNMSPSPPKPPRRRLVKGLRQRDSPSPQKPVVEVLSSDDPLVIDLVDNDQEDAYQAEGSPEVDDEDDRVLNCINNSTLKELAAMTGMKESLLEPIVEKRPFDDLAQARRVSINKKSNSRKSSKISIGDTAVDAIEVFLNAVSAIDEVVTTCETKAQTVRSVMDTWDLDTFGHTKQSTRASPDSDLPPTPTSIGGPRFVRPPVPRQPKRMDGHCTMKPFQLFGLNWMSLLYNNDIGCILADEMGLGKTCQVISFMCHLVEEYKRQPQGERPWPNLVVVPPSTYNNWLGEFEKFAPSLSIMGYRGSQSERAELAYEVQQNPEEYHVVLATYSQINSEADIEAMQSFDLNAAVFDEGHKMKNPETKIYKDLRRIPASWKMLLTGRCCGEDSLDLMLILIRNTCAEQPIRDDFSAKLHQPQNV